MPVNGSVQSITTTPAGVTSVTVTYPTIEDPPGPAQTGSTVTYSPVESEQLASFRQGLSSPTLKVDCNGTPPAPGSVTIHK